MEQPKSKSSQLMFARGWTSLYTKVKQGLFRALFTKSNLPPRSSTLFSLHSCGMPSFRIPQVSISSTSPSHPAGLGLGLGGGALVKAEPLSPRPPDMSVGHSSHHYHLTATRPSSANSHLSPGGAAMGSGTDSSLRCLVHIDHLAAVFKLSHPDVLLPAQ